MTAGTFPLPQKPVVVCRQPGIASPKAPLGPTAVRYECNRDGFTARLKLVCSPELGTKIGAHQVIPNKLQLLPVSTASRIRICCR